MTFPSTYITAAPNEMGLLEGLGKQVRSKPRGQRFMTDFEC